MRRKTEIYKETINRTFKFFKNTLQELEDDEVIKEVEILVGNLDKRSKSLQEYTKSLKTESDNIEELKNTLAKYEALIQELGPYSFEGIQQESGRKIAADRLQDAQLRYRDFEMKKAEIVQLNREDFSKFCVIMAKEEQNALVELDSNRLEQSIKVRTFQEQFEEAAEGFVSCLVDIITLGGNMVQTCEHTIYRHDGNTYEGQLLIDSGETLRFSVNVSQKSIVIADQNLQLIGKGRDFRNIVWESEDQRNADIIRMYRELMKVKTIVCRRDQKFKGKQKLQHVLVNA